MAHSQRLQQLLLGMQAALMACYQGGGESPNAVKGIEREGFIRNFWSEIFPSHRRVGSGYIIDSNNAESGQLDIVIEFGFSPSFLMPGGLQRLYMAESVATVIEVKSDLSAQWDQVISTADKLKKLRRNLKVFEAKTSGVKSDIPLIAVGYSGYEDPDVLFNRLKNTNKEKECPLIDAALCIKSGAFASSDGSLKAYGGHGLLGLCAFITEQLNMVSHVSPNFVDYVADAHKTRKMKQISVPPGQISSSVPKNSEKSGFNDEVPGMKWTPTGDG